MKENFIKKLEEYYSGKVPRRLPKNAETIQASVLLILKVLGIETSLLFIVRKENPNDPYSGHIAFPGGRKIGSDKDLIETAYRETLEEVSIDFCKSGRLISRLDDISPNNPSGKNYIVTPYLSVLEKDVFPIPDGIEVDDYIWVPLNHLVDESNKRVRLKQRGGDIVEDYVFEYKGKIIWGMTGKILNSFLFEIAYII